MPESETQVNHFESDVHRRVAGNLTQPRSLTDLLRVAIQDPFMGPLRVQPAPNGHSQADLGEVLKDLEADGVVVSVGEHDSGEALVATIRKHDQAVTLPDEKAEAFVERAEVPTRYPWPEEEHWALTELGLAKLKGPIPNEPAPLEGEAKKQAIATAEFMQKMVADGEADRAKAKEAARKKKGK